ncbi:MAG: nucleotidyltransferase family protein [Pedobacter sp.]
MTRDEIITFLTHNKSEIEQRYGVTKIGLAGSYARDEATLESDIDIIVEIKSPNKFRSFFYLLYFLQDALGKQIDLVTESSLKPLVKKTILKDIVYV